MKQEAYYRGRNSEYNTNNGKRAKALDSVVVDYSKYQNFLYKKALLGLKIYNQNAVKRMKEEEVTTIIRNQKKALRVISVYKQKKVIELSNGLLTAMFPKGRVTSELLTPELSRWGKQYKVTLKNEDLGITKTEIISLLVDNGVLPKDFYELSLT